MRRRRSSAEATNVDRLSHPLRLKILPSKQADPAQINTLVFFIMHKDEVGIYLNMN